MSEEAGKKHKNSFHLRIYDAEVLKSLNELMKTDKYESMNELLNCAVGVGIEKIYLEFGKRKLLTQARTEPELPDGKKLDKLGRELNKVRTLEEDMYILMNSIKALTASIYNAYRMQANGEPVTPDLLDNYGYMSVLPDSYREIEDNLIARFNRNLGKKE